MRDNITKVSDRGERLDALQDKTDNLQRSAQGFRRGANRVRKAMWYVLLWCIPKTKVTHSYQVEGYENENDYHCSHRSHHSNCHYRAM
jgi:hypothetical protein